MGGGFVPKKMQHGVAQVLDFMVHLQIIDRSSQKETQAGFKKKWLSSRDKERAQCLLS